MKNRAQKIRLGVFLLISLTILFIIIGFFTAREFFKKADIYYITYEGVSVSGLEVGSPVKFIGIRVGAINDISINEEDVNNVIVELALKPGTPIKADAQANITSMGITGLKTIEIRGGTNEAELLEPGSYIPAGSSITEEITGRAEVIAEKAELVLNNLQAFTAPENLNKITTMADGISELVSKARVTVEKIDTLIDENRMGITTAINTMNEVGQRLNESSKSLYVTIDKINKIVEGDTLRDILAGAREVSVKLREAEIGKLINNLARVADQTQQLLIKVDTEFNRDSEDFSESLELLRLTLWNLNEASRKINDNPSILIRGVNMNDIPDQELK